MSTARRFDLGKIVLLIIAGFLVLWMVRGCRHLPFLEPWSMGGWWLPPWLNVFGLGFLIQLGLAVWVGIDAQRRGTNGLLWGLLVFFTSIVGLLVYAIVCTGTIGPGNGGEVFRSAAPDPSFPCPDCARPVRKEYRHCPACGASLTSKCGSCGRRTDPDWNVCAYCGASLQDGS